ncbi:MAG: hypothetical protein ACLFP1_00025 [Candidatus Goldiibacteriota bacterium]
MKRVVFICLCAVFFFGCRDFKFPQYKYTDSYSVVVKARVQGIEPGVWVFLNGEMQEEAHSYLHSSSYRYELKEDKYYNPVSEIDDIYEQDKTSWDIEINSGVPRHITVTVSYEIYMSDYLDLPRGGSYLGGDIFTVTVNAQSEIESFRSEAKEFYLNYNASIPLPTPWE